MFKIAAFFLLFNTLIAPQAFAVEPGYKEALEYFIQRDKDKAKTSQVGASVDNPENFIIDPEKYIIGLGVGEISDLGYFSAELGVSLVQSRYFQQTLLLEYMRFSTKSLKDYKTGSISNSSGNGFFLTHSVQLSSKVFFLSPEISVGVGRIFQRPLKGSVMSFRGGLAYSNKWSQRFLFSAHLYYRRNEYFKADLSGDGFGLTLRFGF